MKRPDLDHAANDPTVLAALNARMAGLDAEQRLDWMLRMLPQPQVLSSSFGAQAAAMLHLLATRAPDMPVILIDTGYLFAETYRFADALTARLGLNLKVYRPSLGAAWLEARHGRLWEQGVDGIERYNHLAKIEPMQRALGELGAQTWYSGLRRSQARSRAGREFLERRNGRWKAHPIADWSDRDIGHYLARHDLPYHPLWDEGYVSIGDVHTTQRLEPGMAAEDTRFFGLKRECGLHLEI
ncbi:MAG: phosphoadenylyl-sulfate reductase [Dokdonella sp.]|uniref:phosphoadenylyl-sulfate reductase n=1 Tax=Dokdonella sp. TaxID=2291710 RepID=UPI0025B969EE|nr:phosphoadenylyl-sulfate reductase [Dokdonella sp.]MBX3702021.1 phosphoadenylyl-sulfate reductase [Dokdonella sp.]